MAKNKAREKTKAAALKTPGRATDWSFSGFNFRALLLVVIGIVLYTNSMNNEYALDDGIVIGKNTSVQRGFAGIKKIMSSDAYESYYELMNAKQQLSGGRYRPLSIVTFAIEQQLFGKTKSKIQMSDPFTPELSQLRHTVNVLFYIFSVILLFYFLLEYVFPRYPDVAFLAALLFLIHPMHTEVVANVKSRDEILSFLFIVLTFICVCSYDRKRRPLILVGGLVSYFLALLSKEYAMTLIVLIPMLLYIQKGDLKKSLLATAPYFIVALVYMGIRYSIVGKGATVENTDVLNNPYMYAVGAEKLATKIEVLDHYLRLLFIPFPLSSDYSYSTIPYINFGNPKVWLAIAIHLGLIAATVVLFVRRNIISFALAFYLLHLFLVSNLVMDIGATMGERLVYHSSLGFVICIAILMDWLLRRSDTENMRKMGLIALTAVATITCAFVVIPRNANWKNDNTLFIHDAEVVPNSALVNGNAGKAYVDLSEQPENKAREKELLQKAMFHLSRAIAVHRKYVNGYLNLGVCYFKLKDYDKAKAYWDTVAQIFPNNPYLKRNMPLLGTAYMNEAFEVGGKDPVKATALLEKAVACDPSNPELWYNLGGASFTMHDYKRAREAWNQTLLLKPDHEMARRGLAAIPAK